MDRRIHAQFRHRDIVRQVIEEKNNSGMGLINWAILIVSAAVTVAGIVYGLSQVAS